MIKAIVFDVGGVLEISYNGKDNQRSVHGYVAKKIGVDLDSYFDIIGGVHEKSIDGRVTRKMMFEVMTRDFKISSKKLEKLYKNGFKKVFRSNKRMYSFAYNLKKKGYKIGILSDQWYLSKDALINPKKMKKFDFVIVSCDVKTRKPKPKIYRIALKKAKCKAGEMIFIDNREWNVEPAVRLGINGIVFEDNEQCFRALKKLGVGV
ncbi:MAG: HAD family phosphatase [Candidatus Pacearchaeota archaeon]|nr:HAD family phosphatase [Candidatus Pacearchaeota archaeon]